MTAGGAPAPAELPPAQQIREMADRILAGPDYQLHEKHADYSPWIKDILDAIGRLFAPVTRGLQSIIDASPVLGWLLVAAMVALAIALLVHILYTLFNTIRGPAGRLRALANAEEISKPEDWEKRAREAAGGGDLIGAIRFLFRAGVLRIERSRERSFRRGVTNHEILRAVGSSALAEPVDALVRTIDYKYYGGADCSAEDFERCSAAYDGIRRLTAGGGPHAARP